MKNFNQPVAGRPAGSIPIIGVIGGIGSGKTALANEIGKFINVERLDADKAGHEVLKQESSKQQLRNEFGSQVFDEQGEVSRSALARLVFGESDQQRDNRDRLEKIVHPEIRRSLENRLKHLQEEHACDVIMLDAALLLEAGWSEICDAIVFLEVPDEIRLKRVHERGWSKDEFQRREASQLSLEHKRTQADTVIDNSGDLSKAARAFVEWLRQNDFHSNSSVTAPQTTHSTV